jgi:hypothetical protein
MAKEIQLPSGATLEITLAPFKEGRALYQAIAEEAKGVKLDMQADIDGNLIKDLFCTGIASKKIEISLADCLKRCTYKGLKVTDDLFEPEDSRQDYLPMLYEVAKENVSPFMKSLYAQFGDMFQKVKSSLA